MRNKLLYALPNWTALFFSLVHYLLQAPLLCCPDSCCCCFSNSAAALFHLLTAHLHLGERSFISGSDTKASSSISRSSSGCDSSPLASPEDHTHPQTPNSTSSSKAYGPCATPSRTPSKSISTYVGPQKDQVPGGVLGRSHSYTELRDPASWQLRRTFSMTLFHRKQRKQLVEPINWKHNESVKAEESTLGGVGPEKESDVTSPSRMTLSRATAQEWEPEETRQSTHLLPAPAPTQRSDHLSPVPSLPNLQTNPPCLFNSNDNMPPLVTGSPSVSATIEAQRLKRQRKQYNHKLCK